VIASPYVDSAEGVVCQLTAFREITHEKG
jgi:hypothetical protein